MNLSGRLIDAFLALEETRRFSIAARRCHVSPSAFSQMIGRLEEKVGTRLFDRDTRNVALTPEGEVFSSGAHRIAAEIHASMAELNERSLLRKGRVSIAAPPSLAAAWLPQLMANFKVDHPGIDIRLHDVVSDRCLDMIARGEVDLGLNAQRGNDLEFDTRLLFNERLYLICREDDPLAHLKQIRLSHLKDRDFIHTVRSGSVWQQMQGLLSGTKIRDSGLEVAQFGTLAGLISSGFGISIVPQLAVYLCNRPGLLACPINARKALRPIYIIKRKDRSLSAAAQAMWNQIEKSPPGGMLDK
ncbi:LysR substrate-binding domain-containing protein [Paralcaligenes sp. KSB-10]|uniref:LysR family transcriptional regulator n=1 Tax=Paralcaligenes sp. KSB-10 TaxID=2901142 RepID=UPI001E375402|nr:LysR family transcriptional regulator [Paralcaligenes sp. KSB-10]UHL65066.1 LysR substrate-binding domain-containing protein [Paralcaligenes sp. KSB-10]